MSEAAHTLTVLIPLSVNPRGGRKAMVTPGVLALERRHDATLIKAVAPAFRWRRMLETGRFATINELAAAEKINSSYVARVLRLTLLAPEIIEAILHGQRPQEMTLPGLMEPFPVEWAVQCPSHRGWRSSSHGSDRPSAPRAAPCSLNRAGHPPHSAASPYAGSCGAPRRRR